MAWTFMNIMNVIHHVVRFCTRTLKDNIMLHFPFDKPNVVYIGVCNWGEVRCIVVTYEIRVFFEGPQKEVFSSIFKKAL